jgi:DNA-binding transcriptional MerR regulator
MLVGLTLRVDGQDIMEAGNVIAAFTDEQVERLTGLTVARLRYWDRTGFFKPAYGEENRRLTYSRIYSFKDVASLRTISALRVQFDVPLQHLRKVAEKLRYLADDMWTGTTLYVLNRKVVWHEPGTEKPKEIVSNQFVLVGLPLKTVIADTRQAVIDMRARRDDQLGRIERSRYVNHNAWVIAGTRIPTGAIRRFKEAGYSVKQIICEYPDLTERDVEAALTHEEKRGAAA